MLWFDEVLGPAKDFVPPARLVLACRLGTPQAASKASKLLGRELPLDLFGLAHLKRIRKERPGEVASPGSPAALVMLLAPRDHWDAVPADARAAWAAECQLLEPFEVPVPAQPAASRAEVRHIAIQFRSIFRVPGAFAFRAFVIMAWIELCVSFFCPFCSWTRRPFGACGRKTFTRRPRALAPRDRRTC